MDLAAVRDLVCYTVDPIGDHIGDPICIENQWKINGKFMEISGNQWKSIDQWKSMEIEIMDFMEIHGIP